MKLTRGRKLKDWITIQKLDSPVEDFDDDPAEWVTHANVRSNVVPVPAAEVVAGQKRNSMTRQRIELRFIEGVTTSMRVSLDNTSRVFNIDKVINVGEKNRWLWLECIEQNVCP